MTSRSICFIGLGKMGSPLVQRLLASGQSVLVYDSTGARVEEMAEKGAKGCKSIAELAKRAERPRAVFLCVPAGSVDEVMSSLKAHLEKGDAVVDLGNSFYKDSQKRAKTLGRKGISFIDVGVSGGVDGARDGACLMIGGDKRKVAELRILFDAMSRDGSYAYLGKSGAGHLVKGFHNLIEYGYLQSLAEGLGGLQQISKKERMGLSPMGICDIWSRGSMLESRLVSDAKKAFRKSRSLNGVQGRIYGQTLGEMRKLLSLAEHSGVKVYSCKAAVKARLDSQKHPTFSAKIVNAIRNVFGGHRDWER